MLTHAGYLRGGWIGVDVFFVLSGFLITTLLVQEFDAAGSISLRHFYMRRFLRLAPAAILMLLVFCLTIPLFFPPERIYYNYVDAAISLVYLTNWSKALSIHAPDVLGHMWSLSTEEQFYILWPLILLTLLRTVKNRLHVAAVAFGIALLSWVLRIDLAMFGATPVRLHYALDTRADTLMVGCGLGVMHASGLIAGQLKTTSQRLLPVLAPAAAAGLIACSILLNWTDHRVYYFGITAIALFTGVTILDVLLNPRSIVGRMLAMKWLVWIGSISYGLYLWHFPIYVIIFNLHFAKWVVAIYGTLMTFVAAVTSYYLLERPIIRLKKRFAPMPAGGELAAPGA